MAHMILCAFVGGPLDGTTREINDQCDEVRFEEPPTALILTPPIAQDNLLNVVRQYHVYKRDDAASFIYGGFQ